VYRLLSTLLALLVVACTGDDPTKDKGTPPPDDSGYRDKIVCRQPDDIPDCILPDKPDKRIRCLGCNCAGPTPAAACNGQNNDCRYFEDGCFPKKYTRCDQSAPYYILGLCGYCFFREAGGVPADCNKILFDASVPKPPG
jgi:hypothetical protein